MRNLNLLAIIISLFWMGSLQAQEQLPQPPQKFEGKIGKTYKDSKEDYPKELTPPAGAPNVIVIMLDDVGFGQPSVNGGPIPTPGLDKFAKESVYYSRFHTTGICSSTRAALLAGRNHHTVANGTITELSTGYPGYNSFWTDDAASIGQVLQGNGYSTAAFGKWHNTPDWETSPAGPFVRWPTNKGFDYFYGFFGGETNQYYPQLYENLNTTEPDKTPQEGYHITPDLVEHALFWAKEQKAMSTDRPVFIYMATGGVHAPLHVPQKWIDKFEGQFTEGWDEMRVNTLKRQKAMGILPENTDLTPRPDVIPSWAEQSADAKKLYARQMQVFAGFLAQTDYEMQRFLDEYHKIPGTENTIVVYIVGDNGASAEGSMTGTTNNMMTQNGIPDDVQSQLEYIDKIGIDPYLTNHYAVPWSWAGCTPFQWMKRVPSHFGGTRNAVMIQWPGHTDKFAGQTRTQFHHIIDIMPTILEAADIPEPKYVNGLEQKPIEGVSMLYTLNNPNAQSRHTEQYFAVGGNLALYKDGWVATYFHRAPWLTKGSTGFDDMVWNLYNIEDDWSQAHDLSAKYPDKLKELTDKFDSDAKKYQVYPLDDRFAERAGDPNRPSNIRGKKHFSYPGGLHRLTEGSSPPVYAVSFDLTADFTYKKGDDGVIVAEGGSAAGYALYVDNAGKVHYYYNWFGKHYYDVVSSSSLPEGKVKVKMIYTQTSKEFAGGGNAVLYINGKQVGKGNLDKQVPGKFDATETLDVGMDLGSPVNLSYPTKRNNFPYTNTIENVTFDLK